MKRFILGAVALLAAAFACASPSEAQTNVCSGGGVGGMLVGGPASACAYLKVNPDGSIPVTGSSSSVPNNVTPANQSPTTLTTTAAQIIAANSDRASLSIQNIDSSINECYSFTSATPVCGAAGTFTITPGLVFFWTRGSVPNSALYMIAASGTPKVSVTEGQ